MSNFSLSALLCLLMSTFMSAQNYSIGTQTGTINVCGGTFTDSGTASSDYGNSENHTLSICSDDDNHVSLSFENFSTQENIDQLYIYDGPNVSSTQVIGSPFSGSGINNTPGVITSKGKCLTFRFTSNADTNSLGWKAAISCFGAEISSNASVWTGYPYSQSCTTTAQIGGEVYEDFDGSGAKNGTEPFIKNIEVKIYNDNGLVATQTTDATGEYTFSSLTEGTVYRVEFKVPSGMEAGAFGAKSGTAVQMVQSGKCDVDLGLVDVAHYCSDADPNWVIPCYNSGVYDHPSNATSTGLAQFLYSDSGQSPTASYNNIVETQHVGSTWGVAVNSEANKIYLSTVLKRHTGVGPAGIGAIYQYPIGGASSATSTFYDFGGAAGAIATDAVRFPGTGNGSGQEGPCGSCDNVDPTTFGQVGKVGLGDIDISADNKNLFVVNLNDRQVYQISTDNPAANSATALPSQPWLNNAICTNGVARPWALKIRRGKLYVGLICDASTSTCAYKAACSDLTAEVYSYDLTNGGWTNELSYILNYSRNNYQNRGSDYWGKWTDTWTDISSHVKGIRDVQFGVPVFADIEFDDDGSIIMGFSDRTAMQLGYNAPAPDETSAGIGERSFVFGDILRAHYNPNTESYLLENNGVVGALTTTNSYSSTGIGGKSFYYGDLWYGGDDNAGVGALAIKPGSGEVMFPVADAIRAYSNGVVWMSNTNGSSNKKMEVYRGLQEPLFAKGFGVGDIQLLCSDPPIEIGNYVWWDLDDDGLMDPSESGVKNVRLELWKDVDGNTKNNENPNGDEVMVAYTLTDDYGRYAFSYTGNSKSPTSEVWTMGHTKVLPNMVYQVRITNHSSDPGITAYKTANSIPNHSVSSLESQGPSGTERDNNGSIVGANIITCLTTGSVGQSNHSIDIGLTGSAGCVLPIVTPSANVPCIGDTLKLCANVTSGSTPYSYNWIGPNNFTSDKEKPKVDSATTAAAGKYYLTVTDNKNCSDTAAITVFVHSISSAISSDDTQCGLSTGSINVTANGTAPYMYDWAHIAGVSNPEDLSNIGGGSYSVSIKDANGCISDETATVSETGGPSISLDAKVNEKCSGGDGSISLTISGSTGVTWAHGPSTEDLTGLSAGSYTVTATDGACTATATYVISNNPKPSVSITSTNATCDEDNGSITLAVSSGTPDFTYNWAHLQGNDNPKDLTDIGAGTYNVTVTDDAGCTETASASIIQVSKPTIGLDNSQDETCGDSNGQINITVSGGVGPFEYLWCKDGVSGFSTSQDLSNLSMGSYTVKVTDKGNLDCLDSLNIVIDNLTAAEISLSVTHIDGNNKKGSIDLTVTGGNVTSYQWDNDGVGDNDDVQDIQNLSPGTYSVTVVDELNCTQILSATVLSSDVAITKELVSTGDAVQYGDTLEFNITVTNQGTRVVDSLVVTDYVPSGLSYIDDAGINPGWTLSGNGPQYSFSGSSINQNDQRVVSIFLKLNKISNPSEQDYTNYAEISYAHDTDGNFINDCDSELNSISTDNGGSLPNTPADDYILGNGEATTPGGVDSTDQDNIDPAMVCIFDLALDNRLRDEDNAVVPGDTVTFDICIHNQGLVATDSIEVTDYIAKGFIYSPINDSKGWTYIPSDNKAVRKVTSGFSGELLDPQEKVCIDICLIVNGDHMDVGDQINIAEISAASESKKSTVNINGEYEEVCEEVSVTQDVDGLYDMIPNNDAGGKVKSDTDNSIDGDGSGSPQGTDSATDEDDHDPACVRIMDLALIKTSTNATLPAKRGDTISYTIEIANQGNEKAYNINVVDYIPEGLSFISSNSPTWTLGSDNKAYTLITDTLSPQTSTFVDIDLVVNKSATKTELINYAEISSFRDSEGALGKDIDSTPDDNDTNDGEVYDDKNQNENGDEDDHDVVATPVFDLALRKVVIGGFREVRIGEIVTYEIEIINQGNIDAYDVEVGDFPQEGLALHSNSSADWKYKNGHYEYTGTVDVAAETSSKIYITMIVDTDANYRNLLNQAEILGARNVSGADYSNYDIDSQPDADFTNDVGGLVNSPSDNQINDVGIIDEDDSDPASVSICEPIACKGRINLSIDNACDIELQASTLLIDTLNYLNSDFDLSYFDSNGLPIESASINEVIKVMVAVKTPCQDHICWTEVLIEDKLPPAIKCPAPDTIKCTEIINFESPTVDDHCNQNIEVKLINEVFTPLCIGDSIIGMTTKSFQAVDTQGNESDICDAQIYMLVPDIDDTQYPSDTTIACNSANNDIEALMDQTYGTPTLDGYNLTSGKLTVCLISASFTDVVIVDQPCKKQIMRMWTVRQTLCSGGEKMEERPQLITITDTIAPTIAINDTMRIISTNSHGCNATFALTSLVVTDNCDTDIEIEVYSNPNVVDYSNGTVTLPIGTHTIAVQAIDNCHNVARDTIVAVITDNAQPLALCELSTVISLNDNGLASIPAATLDGGSHDACSDVTITARRMDSTCDNTSSNHSEEIEFCCNDIGESRMVEVRVTDAAGNSNICMVNVEVQDKSTPSIICPPSLTIYCSYVIGSTSIFGDVVFEGEQQAIGIDAADIVSASGNLVDGVVFGNCLTPATSIDLDDIDDCNTGTITRTFSINTPAGLSASCDQVITIISDPNAASAQITFPSDTSIVGCDTTLASVALMGSPTSVEGRCNNIGFAHRDILVTNPDTDEDLCFKVMRIWSAVETCKAVKQTIHIDTQFIELRNAAVANFVIQGNIETLDDEALEAVEIRLNDADDNELLNDKSDRNGQYAFEPMPNGGNYIVSPYKNSDWINGVSTLDLILIQSHVLGKQTITSPYERIAADVNNDNAISAIDLVMLRKIILGIDNEVSTNTSWRFIWSGQDLEDNFKLGDDLMEQYELNPLGSNMQLDWRGVKVGDISGNAVANGFQKSEKHSAKKISLKWDLSTVDNNNVINFYLDDMNNYNGIQGEIVLPISSQFAGVINSQIQLDQQNIRYVERDNKVIFTHSAIDEMNINGNTPLFSLVINGALGGSGIALSGDITRAEVYTSLNALPYGLTAKEDLDHAFAIHQNEPNPWTNQTTLYIYAPENDAANLKVYDALGKQLYSQDYNFLKGENNITLNKGLINATGVLLYDITYQGKVYSQKMIRVN